MIITATATVTPITSVAGKGSGSCGSDDCEGSIVGSGLGEGVIVGERDGLGEIVTAELEVGVGVGEASGEGVGLGEGLGVVSGIAPVQDVAPAYPVIVHLALTVIVAGSGIGPML